MISQPLFNTKAFITFADVNINDRKQRENLNTLEEVVEDDHGYNLCLEHSTLRGKLYLESFAFGCKALHFSWKPAVTSNGY